jgi:hypothetical protein
MGRLFRSTRGLRCLLSLLVLTACVVRPFQADSLRRRSLFTSGHVFARSVVHCARALSDGISHGFVAIVGVASGGSEERASNEHRSGRWTHCPLFTFAAPPLRCVAWGRMSMVAPHATVEAV